MIVVSKHIAEEEVFLANLAVREILTHPEDRRGFGSISDCRFDNCGVYGPVHLRIRNDSVKFVGTQDLGGRGAITVLSPTQEYLGAFDLRDTIFVTCRFSNVKFIVHPEHELAGLADVSG